MDLAGNNPENKNQNAVIVFDGLCNLCCGFLRFVHANDRKWYFKFTWLQSDLDRAGGEQAKDSGQAEETIVLIENGMHYYRSTAFLKIVKHLRFPWPVLTIGFLIPKIFRDWLYDLVARNRYRIFGRRDACMIPDGELKLRFIER